MKAIFVAASLALPCAVCALAAENSPRPAEPAYRLLVLDGSLVRWALPEGQPVTTVTYAFLAQPAKFENTRNCSRMLPPDAALSGSNVPRSAFRREVRAAFDMWEAAANIRFAETDKVDQAGILIGAEAEPRGRAFTNVAHAMSGRNVSDIDQSLICLNPETRWKMGFDGDLDVYDLRYTVAHEIGHAIGLDHPSSEGQLMSYRYVERDRELTPGDIAGAVALYGAPRRTAVPGDVAGLRSELPRVTGRNAPPAGGAQFGLGETEKARGAARR